MDGWTHEEVVRRLEGELRVVREDRSRVSARLMQLRDALEQVAGLGDPAAATRYGNESEALMAAIEIAEKVLKEEA